MVGGGAAAQEPTVAEGLLSAEGAPDHLDEQLLSLAKLNSNGNENGNGNGGNAAKVIKLDGAEYVCDLDELDPGDLQRLKLLEDVGGLVNVPDQPVNPQPKAAEEESKGEVDESPVLVAPQQPV